MTSGNREHGDGGNSRLVHRAERVRAVQTAAWEGRADPAASLSNPVCIFLPTDRGCQPAPGLSAPSSIREGQKIEQTSGVSRCGNAESYSLVGKELVTKAIQYPRRSLRRLERLVVPVSLLRTTDYREIWMCGRGGRPSYVALCSNARSAAGIASGVPTCIHTPSRRSPNSRSWSLARSNILVSENSPLGVSANSVGDMMAAPA